ncbi:MULTISPECIES: winged helix-turn-helix domain-containing protein [Streptomyces]|uniref:ArsR family transcriptional regulator n=1 Tax=Streptomyces venezuelae TaxID=54571 RepID=A0A5P2B4Y4_STRVZ|nr:MULTISPECIES: winged helix-turn-helix domain-containing protein [Streptomyces]NEA00951.1 winged helix-turn-helix transcriptional regulator [Streptomyces sp. SID10116]MYY86073.1 ArsR family transcriptional regulator [Streptomyces sp. SID335]MYZ19643.1 ArsR family transcriptional regulator [Streptomyces sp. SID337]NDZ90168.1 winged helix-turn-helix transcriptional regulator [Streptomyces sp. SID10115]NEB46159.1 winged helix-turn-helix transcriptional regulator [Streptomyces sp. SID339]
MTEEPVPEPTGDALLKALTALGNPHRMRIVAALTERRNYVSALAREIGMGRPLLHMHLKLLEGAGLVVGSLEVSEDGKQMKYYEVAPFFYALTPQLVHRAVLTLTDTREKTVETAKEAAK